ncbi:MAG: cation diffusion facilitator family transporter [Bacteroidales bacterium]|jgi:cation diffusion facilitator family transporter|nr:cation diffusion facilitator family transporter [Bacteroidales bacterium]
MINSDSRLKQINKVTIVGFFVNLVLTIAKVIAGIIGKSSAMVADGIHSLSDFATDIIVLVFVKYSSKDLDQDHKYGHGKFETFATMIIAFALLAVGIGIFWSGLNKVIAALNGEIIEQPGIIALFAALLSIISKEALYWYTVNTGKKVNSQAVIANAWHHRSDAFSSIGTALGISGAIFLGEKWRILDPIAGIIVSLFIIKVAWELAKPSIKELLESSLPEETENEISDLIKNVQGVKNFHKLKTRKIGNTYAIEAHVRVDKDLSVEASHNIASKIEKLLREKFGVQTHIGIHIEPYYPK